MLRALAGTNVGILLRAQRVSEKYLECLLGLVMEETGGFMNDMVHRSLVSLM